MEKFFIQAQVPVVCQATAVIKKPENWDSLSNDEKIEAFKKSVKPDQMQHADYHGIKWTISDFDFTERRVSDGF